MKNFLAAFCLVLSLQLAAGSTIARAHDAKPVHPALSALELMAPFFQGILSAVSVSATLNYQKRAEELYACGDNCSSHLPDCAADKWTALRSKLGETGYVYSSYSLAGTSLVFEAAGVISAFVLLALESHSLRYDRRETPIQSFCLIPAISAPTLLAFANSALSVYHGFALGYPNLSSCLNTNTYVAFFIQSGASLASLIVGSSALALSLWNLRTVLRLQSWQHERWGLKF